MLFKGNSSRLELLIEKIQANKENHHVSEQDIKDALGTDPGSSWRSETPEDQTSPSPSSCATPNSATDVPDAELTFTVGVTEGTPYACQFCDKAFPRLSYLKKHEQTHSDQMPFRCEFCSRLFKHKRSRDRHIKLHTGDKKYRCSHCEAAFSRSDHLKIHMKTHDNQKPFQCTVCNRGYNTAAALTSHMQNHKKDQQQQQQQQQAQQQQQQNGHNSSSSRASSNNTPSPASFRCLQCGDCFRKPDELQGHMLTHHGADGGSPLARGLLGGLMLGDSPLVRSPFPTPKLACIYCTKDSFTTMEALQLHVQAMHGSILNGELREYSHHSHQASPSPSSLLASPPASGALGSLPFACDLCTMRFGSPQGLHKHALAVHGTKELFCAHCSLAFPSAALFAEHYVLMHGAPEQLKPTDLSKKSPRHHHHHHHHDSKRLKTSASASADGTPVPPLADTPTSAPSMVNQYEHPGTLLCNQCSAALPDFESFRSHLKSHLEEAGGLRGLLGGAGSGGVGGGAGASALLGLLGQDTGPTAKSPVTSAHACPHCGAKFDEQQAFEQHVASHFLATATEYGCQSCLKLFAKPDELQKHLMDIHAHHLYRCSLCKEMFDSKVAIQVHFAVKHSNECKLYRCTACPSSSAMFRSELDFTLHVRSTHAPVPMLSAAPSKPPPQQPYRCLFCRLSFSTELEMQFHLAVHSKQFHCPLCQEAFHVEFLLDKHIQTHHSSQVLNNNSTNAPENLSQQQKSPKSKNSASVSSSSAMCSSTTATPLPSSNPIRTGSSGGNSEGSGSKKVEHSSSNNNNCCCDICDRCDFGSEAELVAHRKLVHHIKPPSGKNGAVSLNCAYCSENCKSRTELENHMKTHSQGSSSSGKHKCNICDELCPSPAVLAEHKLTHCKVVSASSCTQCKATLVNEDQFYTHLQQHSANNNNSSVQGNVTPSSAQQQVMLPTPCVVCRQTLISDIEVRMHARFHLKNSALTASDPLYQCCLCLKQYDLQNLIVASNSNGVVPNMQTTAYVCKDCYHCHSKGSPNQQQQQQQSQLLQQQEQSYRCAECQVKFETSSALEAHLVAVHRKTYQCIKCQMSFESEREIQMHVATHLLTEGSSHECHLCRRLLATPLKLQAHLIEHTFAGCGSFTCYLCSAVFTAAQGLQQHMLEHGLAARPYDCSRCGLRFFFRAELDNHSYSHLEDAASAITDAEMASKMAYYQHLNNNGSYDPSSSDMHYFKSNGQETPKHGKQKNKSHSSKSGMMFKCSDCDKEFSSALGLQAHQRHHKHGSNNNNSSSSSNKRTHVCTECGKEFSLARNLSVHMRSHNQHQLQDGDERTMEESKSSAEENYSSNVGKQEHLYPCQVCQKEFSDLDTLDSHIASHHFRCSQCGEVFSRQRYVEEHVRKVHQIEEGQYSAGREHPSESLDVLNVKQEPVTVKEEINSDENINVSSPSLSVDHHYGSPHNSNASDHTEDDATNSQCNESSNSHLDSIPSPTGAPQNAMEDCSKSPILRDTESVM